MLFDYKMKSFKFAVSLYKAKNTAAVFQNIENSHNHWKKYTERLSTFIMPGDHETMFQSPNIETMIEQMLENMS